MHKAKLMALVVALIAAALPGCTTENTRQDKPRPAATTLQLTQCALKVSGMTCEGCVGAVERGLVKLRGVKAAKVNWRTGDVLVQYDSKKITPEKIVAAFNQANRGFRAQLPPAKTN